MNHPATPPPDLPPRAMATMIYARTVINLPSRVIYPFLPAVARTLGITLVEAGRLVSILGGMGLVAPLFGHLSDRYGRRRLMEVGLGVMALASLLIAVTGRYEPALLAFAGYGLGKALYDPAMLAYVGDSVPYARRGRAIALTELAWSFAWFFGVPIGGLIIEQQGLSALWWLIAALALAGLASTHRLLPPARRHGAESQPRTSWVALLRHPSMLAALFTGFAMIFALETVFILYGAFLEDRFGLALAALGLMSVVVSGAELLAEGGAAAYTDRLGKKRSVLLGLLTFAGALLLLPLVSGQLWGALAGFTLMIFFFEYTIVSFIPLMSEIAPEARATTLALNVAVMGLGRLVAPLIGTTLYARTGTLLPNALLAATVCLLAALVLWRGVEQ